VGFPWECSSRFDFFGAPAATKVVFKLLKDVCSDFTDTNCITYYRLMNNVLNICSCEIELFNCGFKESDNLWWDAFATEFFEDDAMLTLSFSMEDGPKRYSE